ncbi:beta-lactamase-like protein [Triangularia verruculosa]|uniref:Beta-lactamase-like protein n=1 Tax=Triangularia verruculosa TaxID=2587418 RepID=A0AAN6XHS3_9PEZI|nr:beta-lactamase-like protein [Triangularia verruculosa]
MSTFNGIVAEFPDIRVDFFRSHPDIRPPLACFLSHIHSDHLAGLENLRSPFVYCSAATKEMLLRLERFPCRINYAKGILEARVQRYRHLGTILKPIPLETPTILELEPGNHLQVTLFNANHCPGAVMFLFEGGGKAALYTGDIRSEPWFVNAIARSPPLIEYSCGLKTLDTIYIDTSFVDEVSFPTKPDGIRELLEKVSRYPKDTIFHFQAWTYGYEDVWIALSKALQSKIHVDDYKMSIYRSLVAKDSGNIFGAQFHLAPEAPALVGFMCGNTYHSGCLTLDEDVRLHSCEKGNYCPTIKNNLSSVVWIQPIITRLPNGQDIAELGVGGGGEDLEREVELDYLLPEDIGSLLETLCGAEEVSDAMQEQIRHFLMGVVASGRKVPLDLEQSVLQDNYEIKLAEGLQSIAKKLKLRAGQSSPTMSDAAILPKTITFPYSRHSSLPELCELADVFKPRDIWPCTVDAARWAEQGITIEGLFGAHCSANNYRHDKLMLLQRTKLGSLNPGLTDTQVTTISTDSSQRLPLMIPGENAELATEERQIPLADLNGHHNQADDPRRSSPELTSDDDIMMEGDLVVQDYTAFEDCDRIYPHSSQQSVMSETLIDVRINAFQAMLNNARKPATRTIGLISTRDHHTVMDQDLAFDQT